MKSITLRDHEVRRLLDAGGVTVVREVKPQSDILTAEVLARRDCELTLRDYDPAIHRRTSARARWPSSAGRVSSYGPVPSPLTPGEQRWVREAWLQFAARPASGQGMPDHACVDHRADHIPTAFEAAGIDTEGNPIPIPRWRPSTQMPRWASRAVVEVASVRVARLRDLTVDDIEATGAVVDVKRHTSPHGDEFGTGRYVRPDGRPTFSTAAGCFARAWNEQRGATKYADSPWVWVVSVTRAEAA